MTISKPIIKNIINKLFAGEDYRIEVVTLLNTEFLQYAIEFFKKVVEAKFNNKDITVDWYKKEFMNEKLPSDDIAINSGLNKKTISNMYNSARREIVIEASNDHYENLYSAISKLVEEENDLNLTLSIKFNNVSVDLNLCESLIVINTLAVKRAALRGGLWSTAGKRVEKPLMETLCILYKVNERNYKYTLKKKLKQKSDIDFEREIDFYLIENNNTHKCEVKLMGKGNPESADVIFARESNIFIADKLSDMNKTQLNVNNVQWVELRSEKGYSKFSSILKNLKIPYEEFSGDINKRINEILDKVLL